MVDKKNEAGWSTAWNKGISSMQLTQNTAVCGETWTPAQYGTVHDDDVDKLRQNSHFRFYKCKQIN